MIGAAEDAGVATRLRDHGRRVMATNVVKSAYRLIGRAHDHNRLAAHFGSDEVARALELRRAADHLPGAAEDILALEFGDAFVGVPPTADGRSLGKRHIALVGVDDLSDGNVHSGSII